MSTPNAGDTNFSITGEETHSWDGNELEDSSSASASTSVPITSEAVARQIRAAIGPLTKRLEKLCDLMVEIRRDTSRRSEGISVSIQGPLGPRGEKCDNKA